MKQTIKVIVLLLCSSIIFSSCGVMFGGSKFTGSIVAKDHPNAEIYVDGNKLGTGTAVTLHPRNRPMVVELKQDGCEPKTQTFHNTFRTGNFILSVLSWGLLGIAVDLGTGAAYKPDHLANPSIERMSDKNFVFTVNYDGCDE